ncbi:hypothetical protein ASE25_05550 [Terrabacter sp. Root85]|uniref:FlgD immunoglobulin-like domain containing protein n=1 Tax=Terrabacter sp. Root85 TaxID=1736603 RepID=UPI0006FE1B1C|nr:FlgD immunoglobulin-like domain containing protein [Terrabacter sp. Root85]KRC92767.1 hypothetical protein ASE25_05550 [Terrabacter sp. Root85]
MTTSVLAAALAVPGASAAPSTGGDPAGTQTIATGRTASIPTAPVPTGATDVGLHLRGDQEQFLVRPDGTAESLALPARAALNGCGSMASGLDDTFDAVRWHDDVTDEQGSRRLAPGRTLVSGAPAGWLEAQALVASDGERTVELHRIDARTGDDVLIASVVDPEDPTQALTVTATCQADGWTVIGRHLTQVHVFRLTGDGSSLELLMSSPVSSLDTFGVVARDGDALVYLRTARDGDGVFRGTVYRRDGAGSETALVPARSVRSALMTPSRTFLSVRGETGYQFLSIPVGGAPTELPVLRDATSVRQTGDVVLAAVPSGTAGGVYRLDGTTASRIWQPPASRVWAYEASLPPGRVLWSDNLDGGWSVRSASVLERSPLEIGPPGRLAASTYPNVMADGRRTAFQDKTTSRIAVDDGVITRSAGPSSWPVGMSGHRVLDASPGGGPNRFYDVVTGTWRDYGVVGARTFWGPYAAVDSGAGSIRRVDLGTGQTSIWLTPAMVGLPSGWSITPLAVGSELLVYAFGDGGPSTGTQQVGWYAWRTGVHGVISGVSRPGSQSTFDEFVVTTALTDSGPARTVWDTSSGSPVLAVPGWEPMHIGSSGVYWTDDVTGEGKAVALPRAPHAPRHEGNPIAPSTRYRSSPTPWRGEWVFTEPLTSCSLRISTSAGASVATKPCAPAYAALGEAVVDWDGRDAVGGVVPAGAYTWTVQAEGVGGRAVDVTGSPTITGVISVLADSYVPLQPARILDTRTGLGSVKGPLTGGHELALQVAGRGGVPANASAVVLNVTAVTPAGPGFMSVYPSGTTRTAASTLNYAKGQTIANQVVATLGGDGKARIYSHADSHAVVDVAGYYPPGRNYAALPPARLLDTRATKVRLPAGGSVDVQVTGRGGVPSGAASAVLNVTAVSPSAPGFLTVYPTGVARPDASNVNVPTGGVVSGMTVAKLGTGGKVRIFSHSASDVLVDVAGWLPSSSDLTALTPARVLDTRTGLGAPKRALTAGQVVGLQVTGRGGVPATGVTAVLLNLTVTAAGAPGVVTAYPSGSSRPPTSTLNFVAGQTVSNSVLVKVGTDGRVNLHTSAGTQLVADVQAYVRR